jgi:hypothetical protein
MPVGVTGVLPVDWEIQPETLKAEERLGKAAPLVDRFFERSLRGCSFIQVGDGFQERVERGVEASNQA